MDVDDEDSIERERAAVAMTPKLVVAIVIIIFQNWFVCLFVSKKRRNKTSVLASKRISFDGRSQVIELKLNIFSNNNNFRFEQKKKTREKAFSQLPMSLEPDYEELLPISNNNDTADVDVLPPVEQKGSNESIVPLSRIQLFEATPIDFDDDLNQS